MKRSACVVRSTIPALVGVLVFAVVARAQEAPDPAQRRAELEGRKSPDRLVPIWKIHIAEAVESPVDFGQLKPGQPVPELPPLLVQSDAGGGRAGRQLDINASLHKRPTMIILWRG